MNWKNERWLVLDTETTGLRPSNGARVWEVGWAEVAGMRVVARGRWIVDPGVKIPQKIIDLTGVDPSEIEGQPTFSDIADELSKKINQTTMVVAYNSPFDRGFFENEYRLAGKTLPDQPWVDPLVWSRQLLDTKNHKLITVANHFRVKLENAHRADADAVATANVVIEFLKNNDVDDVLPDDLWMMMRNQEGWRHDQDLEFKARRQRRPASTTKIG